MVNPNPIQPWLGDGEEGEKGWGCRAVGNCTGSLGLYEDGMDAVNTPNYYGHFCPLQLGKQGESREAPRTVLSAAFGLTVHFVSSASPQRFPISWCLFWLLLLAPKTEAEAQTNRALVP